MEELARLVVNELDPALSERTIQIIIHPMPSIVRGDRGLLHHVWLNLLSNAIKYTKPSQAARIEVGAHQQGDQTCYYVKDNGVGFDMRFVDQLFKVFQRLHSRQDFEGTGVGLALVRRIIERHGGLVWAEGTVNEGATFYFTLPGGDTSKTNEKGEAKNGLGN
jgi:light-regulated signal transduction histidine kinase (bacteriophytochrome)